VFERFDVSESRVAFSPQITIFHRAFERNRGAVFLWLLSFAETKESDSPSGDIFAKRTRRKGNNEK
jgi:hypothetical protein